MIAMLKRWWAAYTAWRIEQAAITELSSFSDRELRDIGVNRSGIPAVVAWRRGV